MSDMTLRARLTLDPANWRSGLLNAGGQLTKFKSLAARELSALNSLARSTGGALASIGLGLSAANTLRESAMMDKGLTRIGITAKASSLEVAGMRRGLFLMAKETGSSLADLQSGVSSLVGSGLSLRESMNTMTGINRTMAVTGASAETLAGAMSVASNAFRFDLNDAKQAQLILDRMTVAADLGSAEVEKLGDIFSKVGVSAQSAGFNFNQTLALVEGLSKYEKNSDRLGTLTDSTLRLFTNQQYMRAAQKASGVKFFTEGGMRRDPLEILDDLKRKMDRMKTDAQRESFLGRVLGGADLDTVRGVRMLTTGNMLNDVRNFSAQINNASGRVSRELPRALSNSVDQVGRLKATLFETADGFGQRLNKALSGGISKLLDSKEKGGLGLSGGEVMAGAGVATLAAYVGGRTLKGAAGRLLGGTAGLASGVAMGSALEKAGAATPVFIVGAAPGLFAGAGGSLGGVVGGAGGAAGAARLGGLRLLGARAALAGGSSVLGAGGLMGAGAGGIATTAGGVGLAALGGWAVGSLANAGINSNKYTRNAFQFLAAPSLRNASYTMAALGNSEARATVADEYRQGRGMSRLEMATAGGVGPFNWLAQTLMRVGRETKQRRELEKLAVDVSVTDKRVYATVQQAPGGGSGVVATVRNRAAPATGRMMPGSGQ